ncbi:unnamed protein product [Prunus armeniaca]|uniref:Uncharacterized protein n=1 Tax=Prunus armeniaca TaxID=36596 RepID=A0A6J5TK28_PRUAR|nr:unnamed protein product [Prunus armeniaca]
MGAFRDPFVQSTWSADCYVLGLRECLVMDRPHIPIHTFDRHGVPQVPEQGGVLEDWNGTTAGIEGTIGAGSSDGACRSAREVTENTNKVCLPFGIRVCACRSAREVTENSTSVRLPFGTRGDARSSGVAMTLVLPCACVTRVRRAAKSLVISFTDARRFSARISRRRQFLVFSNHRVNKMSDTESDYSDSPRAFEGELASESSSTRLDSDDFKVAEVVGGTEVSTESGSTSSVEVVEINNSQPSTSGCRAEATKADVLVVDPGEG